MSDLAQHKVFALDRDGLGQQEKGSAFARAVALDPDTQARVKPPLIVEALRRTRR